VLVHEGQFEGQDRSCLFRRSAASPPKRHVYEVAVGAAPFRGMPSNQEILRRVSALFPDARQNEPDQHIISKVILKQFTEPWGKKGELLLASLSVRHPERRLVRGGPTKFGKIPNSLRFASHSAEDLWGKASRRGRGGCWHGRCQRQGDPVGDVAEDGRRGSRSGGDACCVGVLTPSATDWCTAEIERQAAATVGT
jgi:hypothetical protein